MSDTSTPPNPVLTAYDNFVRETPLVTRLVITSQFAAWVLSFFVDPSFAVANIPHFTIFNFEIYRILLSPFICPGFLSLVFAYISFTDNGRRLEFSMGSASFGGLLLTLGTLTNVAHVLVCFIFYGLTGKKSFLFLPSLGIWIILFAVIVSDFRRGF
jgi:membrane associated rhomboid family serine protease